MKITEIREKTFPISSPIRNAYIDFSKMTLSLVAVVTDVVRDGKRIVGYGFNSNGRYGQGTLMRERFIPRLLEADPKSLVTEDGDNLDPHKVWNCMYHERKAGRPWGTFRRHRHDRHGSMGLRGEDRGQTAVSALAERYGRRQAEQAGSSSMRPAATIIPARTTMRSKTRCAAISTAATLS